MAHPSRRGPAPRKSVAEAAAAMARVGRMPWHPEFIPGHTSEEFVVKAAARPPVTPLQMGAGLLAGAAGLRALLRGRVARPAIAPPAPIEPPQEEEMATKKADGLPDVPDNAFATPYLPDIPDNAFATPYLPDIPDDAFAPSGGLASVGAYAPDLPRPRSALQQGYRPFTSPTGMYAAAPRDFPAPVEGPPRHLAPPPPPEPKGLLSQLQGFYDESVSPHVQGAVDWVNDNPLPTAGLLGLGGLGAYGAYRAMQPDEEDEEEGPVKMGGEKRAERDDVPPESLRILLEQGGGLPSAAPTAGALSLAGMAAAASPFFGMAAGGAKAPQGYFGQGLSRGMLRGLGTAAGVGAGGLLGLSQSGGTDPLNVLIGAGAGGLGGYALSGRMLGDAPWDEERDDSAKSDGGRRGA